MYLISAADEEIKVSNYQTYEKALTAMLDEFVKAINVSDTWQMSEAGGYAKGKIIYRWKIAYREPSNIRIDGDEITYENQNEAKD